MDPRIFRSQRPRTTVSRGTSSTPATPTSSWHVVSPVTPKQGSSKLPDGDSGGDPKTPFLADYKQSDTPADNSTGKPKTPTGK